MGSITCAARPEISFDEEEFKFSPLLWPEQPPFKKGSPFFRGQHVIYIISRYLKENTEDKNDGPAGFG